MLNRCVTNALSQSLGVVTRQLRCVGNIPSGHEEIRTEIQRKQKRLYFLENQKNKSGIFSFLNSVSVVIRVTFLSLVGAMTYSLLTEEPPKNASFMSTPTVPWRSLWPLQLETSSGIISRTQWNRFFILSSCWLFSPKKKKNNDIKVWVFQGVTKNFCWLVNTVTPTLGPTNVFPHRGFYYNGRQDQARLDHVRFSAISTGDRYLFRDLIGWFNNVRGVLKPVI